MVRGGPGRAGRGRGRCPGGRRRRRCRYGRARRTSRSRRSARAAARWPSRCRGGRGPPLHLLAAPAGLRSLPSWTVSVSRTVPSPSAWIAPPSLTERRAAGGYTGELGDGPERCAGRSPSGPALGAPAVERPVDGGEVRPSVTKVGPMSRIQASSSGRTTSSTSGRAAPAPPPPAPARPPSVTGSKRRTARATAAQARRASASSASEAKVGLEPRPGHPGALVRSPLGRHTEGGSGGMGAPGTTALERHSNFAGRPYNRNFGPFFEQRSNPGYGKGRTGSGAGAAFSRARVGLAERVHPAVGVLDDTALDVEEALHAASW